MLDFGPGTFFLTPSQVADCPSARHGVSAEAEKALRIYACEMIQEAGILLRLPQSVAATAQVILHRFFCKQSFCDFDARSAAASCFWLAMKLEEENGAPNRCGGGSRLKDVVCMFEHVRARRDGSRPLTPHTAGFERRKEDLLKLEKRILVELGFCCHLEHPHKLMLSYLNCLEAGKDLIQESWNLVNDSLRTTLCVCYQSNVIACGVIFAAARRLSIALPENPPWWALFDVTRDQIGSVINVLADLYRQPKSRFIDVKAAVPTASSAVASPLATSSKSLELQSCPQDLTSNFAKSADVLRSDSSHEVLLSSGSGSEDLRSCPLDASGCNSSNFVVRDDTRDDQLRLSSSETKKRRLESPDEAERRHRRHISSHDKADKGRRGSTYRESCGGDLRREHERKHRQRGDYSRCSRFYECQSLSSRYSYGHVRG